MPSRNPATSVTVFGDGGDWNLPRRHFLWIAKESPLQQWFCAHYLTRSGCLIRHIAKSTPRIASNAKQKPGHQRDGFRGWRRLELTSASFPMDCERWSTATMVLCPLPSSFRVSHQAHSQEHAENRIKCQAETRPPA